MGKRFYPTRKGYLSSWDPDAFNDAREEADCSIEELRRSLENDGFKVSSSTISSWGDDRKPRTELLGPIARALGVTQATLKRT